MKTKILSWVLLISISAFSFVSCDKEDKDNFVFSVESLKQTTWEGTELVTSVTDGEQVKEANSVLIQFFTTNEGQCVLKTRYETEVREFNYVIEGKIMEIDGDVLNGKWTLLNFNKDKMILVSYSLYKVTLTLSRVH
ncbi:MAG: hypothetical protein LBB84_09200 [Tannerellaceae bacterium]|jgi:hypothetical protein|nr:hypothetical protein [Tannerellaceae bacterium]